MLQEGRRCRVEVDADVVDDRRDDLVQGGRQGFLVDIVLILADADGPRVDLDRFGQRVLDAAGDGNGAADGDVQVRQFLPGQVRCGIDGRAGFVGDDVAAFQVIGFDEMGYELFRFIRGRPVADGNEGDAVAAYHVGQADGTLVFLLFRVGQVVRAVVEDLSRRADDGGLAARPEARVQAQDDLAGKGRLQQEVAEIFRKDVDGLLFGLCRQFVADFPFHLRRNEALVTVGGGVAQDLIIRRRPGDDQLAEHGDVAVCRLLQGDFQFLFVFAAVDGQDAVARDTGDAFAEVGIGQHGTGLVFFDLQAAGQAGLLPQFAAQVAAEIGPFRKAFGQDVGCALDGVFDGRYVIAEKGQGGVFRSRALGVLAGKAVGQRFQAGVAGHGGLRPFLGFIGQVEVFDVLELPGRFQAPCQVVVPAALVHDGLADRFFAAGQGLFVFILLLDAAQLYFVEGPCRFFPVAGDERDGIALGKEGKGRLDLRRADTQSPGDFSDHRFLCHDYIPS